MRLYRAKRCRHDSCRDIRQDRFCVFSFLRAIESTVTKGEIFLAKKREKNSVSQDTAEIDSLNKDDEIVFSDAPQRQGTKLPRQKSAESPSDTTITAARPAAVPADKLSKKRITVNVICSVLGALLIIAGSVSLAVFSVFNRVNYATLDDLSAPKTSVPESKPNDSVIPDPDVSQQEVSIDTYSGTLLSDPMILNIMLFGEDTRKGATSGQSDTMILFSIDTRHKKLKMLSFMRDTYLEIPGYGTNRINAAYTYGGASLAVQTIQANYGIKIDRYALVDFKSFRNIIDTLGGIDIELRSEEIDYINWQCWTNNQVDTRYELDVNDYTFYKNDKGESVAMVHLNGRQALWHARNRGEDGICSGDDYTRTERQRNVIHILIDELKKSDPATIMSVVYEIGPMITTNLKASEITTLSSNVMKYLKYDIVSSSAPLASTIGIDYYYSDSYNPVYINGYLANVILIYDWNSFRQKVAEFIFEDEVKKAPEESEISENTEADYSS